MKAAARWSKLGTVPLGDVLDEGARAERRRLRAVVRTERDHWTYQESARVVRDALDRLLARMRAPKKR